MKTRSALQVNIYCLHVCDAWDMLPWTSEYKYLRTLQICSIYLTSNGYGNKIFDVTVWVNLTMEAVRSAETSANFHQTTPHIPEDIILHSNLCENPNSCFRISHSYTALYFISYVIRLCVWLCNIRRPRHFLHWLSYLPPCYCPVLHVVELYIEAEVACHLPQMTTTNIQPQTVSFTYYTTLHTSTQKYYQYSQNLHDTLKQETACSFVA
jgi:hypothetical protein